MPVGKEIASRELVMKTIELPASPVGEFQLPQPETPNRHQKPLKGDAFKLDLTISPDKWAGEGFSAETIKMVSRVGLVKNFLI